VAFDHDVTLVVANRHDEQALAERARSALVRVGCRWPASPRARVGDDRAGQGFRTGVRRSVSLVMAR
jgi:hypothetical protein